VATKASFADGLAAMRGGNHDQALACFGAAKRPSPKATAALAECYYYLGRDDDALAACDRLKGSDCHAARAHYVRGLVWLRQGKAGEARRELVRAVALGDTAAVTLLETARGATGSGTGCGGRRTRPGRTRARRGRSASSPASRASSATRPRPAAWRATTRTWGAVMARAKAPRAAKATEAKAASAAAGVSKYDPPRHPQLRRLVRRRLRMRLRELGYGSGAAADGEAKVTDGQITEAAAEVRGLARGPVRGSFFDWLLQHLPDILKVVEMLLPLVLAFLGPKGRKGR
jgi:tetratricopeptide (TPR) repeat protein